MTKQLTVHNATITTAAVEVKTLTISGKQVTLAVFRQLQEETILNPVNATLTGELWGRVNYHPDKCADAATHVHVVWQKDGELRRAHVRAPEEAAHKHLHAGLYAEAVIADGLIRSHLAARRPDRLQVAGSPASQDLGFTRFIHRGVQFHGPVRKEFLAAYGDHPDRLGGEELWGRVRHVAGPDATVESIAERLPALAYHQSWRQLAELPQLFIAV
ncbi:hypothetical protein [Actinacidiphila oryziradicis]|uniref:Uncharacterized protein n=1 Tax=Actinacidiphila oryziradicis TaxID=2571141 RepID=A0A4V5N0E5_9ACTN|nr:hypothetical protein [Actinacidiphila oryziradicis]TKA11739.1 hypothetical protein FCI23_10440 [Actinacidiphila oryziradicis]